MSLRTQTPEIKLIGQLARAIELAREALIKHDRGGALAELEYAQACIIPDSFFEHPEMLTRGKGDVTCARCHGYVPGHATGNADICTCEPITKPSKGGTQ